MPDHHDAARLDDLRWLLATGESADGAAYRLGVSSTALEKWCQRHGHTDLWNALVARNPRDWNRAANQGATGLYTQTPRGQARARWRKGAAA